MTRHLLVVVSGLGLLACTRGPEDLGYPGVAVALQVHLADPPGPTELRPKLDVLLEPLPFCHPESPFAEMDAELRFGGSFPVDFDPAAPSTRVLVRAGDERHVCVDSNLARFYRPSADLWGDNVGTVGYWVSHGHDLAWTDRPTTLALFGPDGPKLSLPVG